MSAPNDPHDPSVSSGPQVRVLELINRLRKKLGAQVKRNDQQGYIDPEAIKEADALIDKMCAECPQTMAALLDEIVACWDEMKDKPRSDERDELGKRIFTTAHEIKDLGAMCGYEIAAYFAESLRDYIARTELRLKAQRVIIQAHVDALIVVQREGLRDEGGTAADELKAMVKIAIDKYS